MTASLTDWGTCSQCGQPAVETVITVNGWLLDVCHACAIEACDPTCAPSPVQDTACSR